MVSLRALLPGLERTRINRETEGPENRGRSYQRKVYKFIDYKTNQGQVLRVRA